MMTLGSIQS